MGQEQSCGKVTKVKRPQSEFMMGVVRTSNGLCEKWANTFQDFSPVGIGTINYHRRVDDLRVKDAETINLSTSEGQSTLW